jgi:heptosyltransferase II
VNRLAYSFIHAFGWLLGNLPTAVVRVFCRSLGGMAWRFSARRRTILGGLARAFPERDEAWRQRIGRENAARLLEMFLLILALPHWSARRQRERIRLDPSVSSLFEGPARGRPVVFLIPHSAMTEALSLLPFLHPDCPEIVTLYRPLDFAPAERYVHWARERWGLRLVSRREGLLRAKEQLQAGRGAAAVLFDQSAGNQGHLMLFLNRVCSTTNLPGLLAAKTKALPVLLRTRRDGFWRGTLEARILPESTHPGEVMSHANAALEELLRSEEEACADWFWAHKRWKGTLRPPQLFSFPHRKSYLREDLRLRGLQSLPRTTLILLWLDPGPELLPTTRKIVRLLRQQRPDAHLTLLLPPVLAGRTDLPGSDRRIELPEPTSVREQLLAQLAGEYPDVLLVFDNHRRTTNESRLLPCELRAGISLPGSSPRAYHRSLVLPDSEYRGKPFEAWSRLLAQLGLPPEEAAELLRPA